MHSLSQNDKCLHCNVKNLQHWIFIWGTRVVKNYLGSKLPGYPTAALISGRYSRQKQSQKTAVLYSRRFLSTAGIHRFPWMEMLFTHDRNTWPLTEPVLSDIALTRTLKSLTETANVPVAWKILKQARFCKNMWHPVTKHLQKKDTALWVRPRQSCNEKRHPSILHFLFGKCLETTAYIFHSDCIWIY